MRIDWDAAKEAANRRKHGVSFDEASEVLEQLTAITVPDVTHSCGEPREKTIGMSLRGRVLMVVHTEKREETIRIISARKADRREVADYEAELKDRFA